MVLTIPPRMCGDLRLDQMGPQRPQSRDRAFLVKPDQARVSLPRRRKR